MWRQLWNDESGVIQASSYLFFVTLLCIGTVCGWVTIRDQVTQELGDLSVAFQNIDQSFSLNYTLGTLVVTTSFIDDDAGNGVAGAAPACISLVVAGSGENGIGGAGGEH
jgi:hypothetical protein